ncbi:hypothetical protein BKA04_001181 [Cryobacterium mesophilum]|nr:hypothetical protein [Terrimesophilobacter mesophilus]
MKITGKLQRLALAATVAVVTAVGTVGIGAASAQAAGVDDVASWITDATLDRLGVTVADPALSEALRGAVQSAVDSGLITTTVEDLAEQAVEDPDSVSDEDVDGTLDGELEEQTGVWQDIALAWHTAFDEIKADFAECRAATKDGATEGDTTEGDTTEGDTTEGDTTEGDTTEGDTTDDSTVTHGVSECAHEFRYAMQLNHLEAWQARHDAKLARIAALPDGQREKAMAIFEAQGERAAQRLEKAAALLERQTGDKTHGPKSDDQRGNKGHNKSDRGNSQRGNSGK